MTPQKIALLTDSCADLSPQLAAENQVFVVPLRIPVSYTHLTLPTIRLV